MGNASRIFDDVLDDLRPKGDRWRGCIVGDFSGNTDAPLDGWKYVRVPIAGSGNYALGMFPGGSVPGTAYNTPVIIEYDPLNGQRIIVGADTQGAAASIPVGGTIPDPNGYSVPQHGWTHQLGGGDQMVVANEQLSNLQLSPASPFSSHVTVKGGVYTVSGLLVKLSASVDVDLTSYFPASGVKYVWVTMTAAGSAAVIDGGATSLAALTVPSTINHIVGFVMLMASQPVTWTNIKNTQGVLFNDRAWLLGGNDGVDASVNFIGSINAADVVFKRSNAEGFRLTASAVDSLLPVRSKPASTAGIQLDPNAATGNFTLSLSPANLTGNRRVTLGDADLSVTGGGTISLGGFTVTVPATGTVALATGIAGGQTVYGGTQANDDLLLWGTSHAIKTTAYILLWPEESATTGKVGIATAAPKATFSIGGTGNPFTPTQLTMQLYNDSAFDHAVIGVNSYWSGAFQPENANNAGTRLDMMGATNNAANRFSFTISSITQSEITILTGAIDSGATYGVLNANSRLYVGAGNATTGVPLATAAVKGNLAVGSTYANATAPSNGAAIEGNVIVGGLTASTVIYSNASKQITSLADAAGYLHSDGAGTFTWAAAPAHNILSASHSDAVTATLVAGDILYVSLAGKLTHLAAPVSGYPALQFDPSGPINAPFWGGTTFYGTAGGAMNFAVTSGKILTLTATDTFGLTVAGTCTLTGGGASSNLSLPNAAISLLGGGASCSLTLPNSAVSVTGGGTLAMTAAQTYTFPGVSATLAQLGANTFTATQTISGVGSRIAGDFSNATQANRLLIQSSTTDGATLVGVIPNGAGTIAGFNAYNNSDLTAALSLGQLYVSGTAGVILNSGVLNSGTQLPLLFAIGGVEKARIATTGDVSIASTTDSSSTITGSLITAGGLGVAKSATIGANLSVIGGQIAFPATQIPSAGVNTLDDYEEGTVTVTLTASTSGTITLDINTLAYTKVGRLVTVTGLIRASSVSSPVGNLTLNGLPFTCANGNQFYSAVSINGVGLAATATTSLSGYVNINATTAVLFKYAAGTVSALAGDIQANTQLFLHLIYFSA